MGQLREPPIPTGFRSCKVQGAVIKGIYRFQRQLRGRSGSLDSEMKNIFPRLGRAKVRFPGGEILSVYPSLFRVVVSSVKLLRPGAGCPVARSRLPGAVKTFGDR